MTLTPTKFSWPAGPGAVQVSGDWDGWKDKVDLDKQADGSFEKEIPLPENKRVHFKYIVDGGWTTKSDFPTVDDAGNVNNIIDVGPAPATTATAAPQPSSSESKSAGSIATGGVAAAATATAAAIGGAAGVANDKKQVINAATSSTDAGKPASVDSPSQVDKKAEPASAVKDAADSDLRNALPSSLTSAAHAAVPVVASAVATVTGADILRGNPEELPVSTSEAKAVRAEAAQNSSTSTSVPTSENAKAGADAAKAAVATSAAPAVPVGDSGFAANVDATRAGVGKEGGVAAGAIASAGLSDAKQNENPATSSAAPAAAPAAQSATTPAPTLDSKTSGIPAAATAATTTTITNDKSLPNTPSKVSKTKNSTKAPEAPSTPVNGKGTVKDKKGTIRSQLKGSEDSSDGPSTGVDASDRKRKQSLFGKIKSALSPHSSPSK